MAKFKKGQHVVCVHYKDRPIVRVDSVDTKDNQLWVVDNNPKSPSSYWYGPLEWFKRVRVR